MRGGLLSLEEACSRYMLSADEFLSWQASISSTVLLACALRASSNTGLELRNYCLCFSPALEHTAQWMRPARGPVTCLLKYNHSSGSVASMMKHCT